jgi:hypothetical protein
MVDGRGPAGIGRVAIKGTSCKRLRTHCMNHPHQSDRSVTIGSTRMLGVLEHNIRQSYKP